MTDTSKGALLGGSNLLAIWIGLAIDPEAVTVPLHLEIAYWPLVIYGVVGGLMLGLVANDLDPLPRGVRTFLLVLLALLMVAVVAPLWPSLMPLAVPFTIVHALILARWTAPASLPGAIVRGRR
jgi:hypothetical protein